MILPESLNIFIGIRKFQRRISKICMICGLLKARVTRSAVTVESFPPLKETNISVILKFSVTLLIYPFASSTIRLYRSLLHKIKRSICSSKY